MSLKAKHFSSLKTSSQGISPQRMDDLIGQKLKRNME